jgi:biotin carboxyl carrier protein
MNNRGGTTVATEIKVPDIGDFKDVPIIDVLVKEGDTINAEDPVITLESDKATMLAMTALLSGALSLQLRSPVSNAPDRT